MWEVQNNQCLRYQAFVRVPRLHCRYPIKPRGLVHDGMSCHMCRKPGPWTHNDDAVPISTLGAEIITDEGFDGHVASSPGPLVYRLLQWTWDGDWSAAWVFVNISIRTFGHAGHLASR